MKLAIVHDDFLQWGGAERVVAAIAEVWPNAPIFTSVSDPKIIRERFAGHEIRQSFLKSLPAVSKLRRVYLPLYAKAFEQFDFSEFDVILSSSTRFAHAVKKPEKTILITYCHAPPRFVWRFDDYLEAERFSTTKKLFARPWVERLRRRDAEAAKNVTYWIANSKNVAAKIKELYHRDADILYPFVDTSIFVPPQKKSSKDYLLVVSRLAAWKRIDIAIEACKKLDKKLVIVGVGPDLPRLQKIARGSDTSFIAQLTDAKLSAYYRNCEALILTQNEDFGLTALEAQACGRPVLALRKGGALETVVGGKTGDFFKEQTAASLSKKLQLFEADEYASADCRKQAMRFSKDKFQKEIEQYVIEKVIKKNSSDLFSLPKGES